MYNVLDHSYFLPHLFHQTVNQYYALKYSIQIYKD
jgi:hypothetical protein